MDLEHAVTKHAEWKLKFRSAINKQETLDKATISSDNCCDVGKWLHTEAKVKFGKLPSYAEAVAKHKEFHVEAGLVVQLINAKKYNEAAKMLEHGTRYTSASTAVGIALLHLKKEAGL